MAELLFSQPDIYKIDVVLPNSPLQNLNCYVVKTQWGNLVVDTGFNRPECLQTMQNGLAELGVDMDRTTLFLTHLHSDHTGLAAHISTEKTRILMSQVDYDYMVTRIKQNGWTWMEEHFRREGLSQKLIEEQMRLNPARIYAPGPDFSASTLTDGDTFSIGPYTFRCILTPGHTPGHMCLYLEEEKVLFCGDHILFNISPNIAMWQNVEDSLGDYLASLEKIRALDIRLALPAHRKNDMDVYQRIAQLEEHHDRRLKEVVDILRLEPGLNACEIGARMRWSMRGRNWEEFPIQQKWFAIGETIAHLDYLVVRGEILRWEEADLIRYYLP